jgi:metal-dependent amidase/aminoacylase/carboxypeptidase family protein
MAVFQRGEETGEGALAMVKDGLAKRFPKPTVALAQHVLPLPAGQTAIPSGLLLSRSDSLRVTLFGRGGHGSSPQTTVDPVVMAAATVLRLQTVVSARDRHDGQRRRFGWVHASRVEREHHPGRGRAPAQHPHVRRSGA